MLVYCHRGNNRLTRSIMKQLLEFIPIILFFTVYQFDGGNLRDYGLVSYGVGHLHGHRGTHRIDSHFSPHYLVADGRTGKTITVDYRGAAGLWWRNAGLSERAFHPMEAFNFQLGDGYRLWGRPQVFGSKNFLERLMGAQITLPAKIWGRLCWVWVAHFTLVGILNLVVAYRFEEATWVAYKLWSGIAFTILLMIITTLIMSPWMKKLDTRRRQ